MRSPHTAAAFISLQLLEPLGTCHSTSRIHSRSQPQRECRRRTDLWGFMDTPCVITHRRRRTLRMRPASARPPRSLHPESPSPSTLCWPRRRSRAAAGAALLSAQTNTTQQLRLRRSLGTAVYPSQQLRQRRRTSARRPCCTQPATCHLDILSTAALPTATSRHVEAQYTHKVKQRFKLRH